MVTEEDLVVDMVATVVVTEVAIQDQPIRLELPIVHI